MTSTTNLPNPRDVLIESLAQDVEVAHTTHVTAYAINRAKTYGWVPPATSTGQENEPKSLAVCLQASDAFDAILRERLNHAFDAGKTAASQCLHQIQEPPTKTEALAHYSQQAILAMGEASAAAVAVPDERAAFEKWWSTPALWSHGHKDAQWEAWQARAALAATPAAWAKPVSELLGHINDVLPDNAFDKIDTKKWNAVSALVGAITPAAAAPVVLPEPAEFQCRTKPEWDAKAMWTDWEKCKPESAADYERVPVLHNWMYEVRRLYTEQQVRALLAGVSAPAALAVAWRRSRREFHEYEGSAKEDTEGFAVIDYSSTQPPFGDGWEPLYAAPQPQASDFQQRVQPWMMACFGPEISADRIERNHRFLEESLELVQSLGCTASEAHQLVDYVFGRAVGEPMQEAGGVMVTLAALCLAQGLDMHAAGDVELARIWTKVEAIRAKQAAKPKHSPLPIHAPQARDARIYTYSQQPTDNVIAWRFGEACSKVHQGGDYIDHGLSLLQQLQEKGYGITAIAAQTAQQTQGGE